MADFDQRGSMKRPAVCIWLKVYCLVMLVFLGVAVALALAMILAPEELLKNDSTYRRNPEGATAMLSFFGVVFVLIFGLPIPPLLAALVWPRGPAAWYVGIVAIVAGFFTSIGWLGTVPLAVAWMRPEVKQYFGLTKTP